MHPAETCSTEMGLPTMSELSRIIFGTGVLGKLDTEKKESKKKLHPSVISSGCDSV